MNLLETTIQNGFPFVLTVLGEDTGLQVATQLDGLSALAILNMAQEGMIGEMMKPHDETEH